MLTHSWWGRTVPGQLLRTVYSMVRTMQRSFCCLASDNSSNQHDQQGHDQKDEKEGVFQGELHTGSPFGSYARFFFEGSCVLSYHRKDWNV